MHTTALLLLLAASPAEPPPPADLTIDTRMRRDTVDPAADCVARRLTPFLSPYGIQQAWPVMAYPPPELLQVMGTPISDMGHIADGYQHFLHVDATARAVHVVEQGGFAGTTKVYGPLPLPRCAPTMEAPPH